MVLPLATQEWHLLAALADQLACLAPHEWHSLAALACQAELTTESDMLG